MTYSVFNSGSNRIDNRLAILNCMAHHFFVNIQTTVQFEFGAADWTSVIALQPRLDASPMENVLWIRINNLSILFGSTSKEKKLQFVLSQLYFSCIFLVIKNIAIVT
jgi:hypothetical protein